MIYIIIVQTIPLELIMVTDVPLKVLNFCLRGIPQDVQVETDIFIFITTHSFSGMNGGEILGKISCFLDLLYSLLWVP